MNEKPPIGVLPKALWYEDRIVDLSRAIHQYCKKGMYQDEVYVWICELYSVFRQRERHLENKESKDLI